MRSSIRLFSLSGIEVGIHPTWFIAFAFITWTFATALLPRESPGWTSAEYWGAGLISAALLFLSVLVHELAHSFTARFLGLPVHGITLFLFGGVSRISGEVRHASVEFFVSFAGPASSLAIGGVCMLAASQLTPADGPQPLAVGILAVLGYVNLFLGAFNLLPGYPLDGGRVLRSIVWGVTKNPAFATRVAATSGRVVAIGMIAIGAMWLVQGQSIAGLWMIFLAVFLLGSASQERREATPPSPADKRVISAFVTTPDPVDYNATLAEVARSFFLDASYAAVPVARDGELVGFIDPWDAKRHDQVHWQEMTVGPLAERNGFTIAEPSDSALALLRRLASSDHRVAAVFNGPDYLGAATIDTLRQVLTAPSQEAG